MALPNLPTTYTTRKNIYEAAIVHRRTHEDSFRETWGNTAKYFMKEGVQANKKHKWESNACFQSSMDAYKGQEDRETKLLNLKRRRLKLAEMLREERSKHESELKGLSSQNYVRLEDMKERSETLRSAREEKRQETANDKLYQHFRVNNPDLRKIESKQHEKHVINEWRGQREELKQREEEERKMKENFEAELHRQQMVALERERQEEQDKVDDEIALKDMLKHQMDELRSRETDAKELKRKEDLLMRGQWEFDELESERKLQERQRRKLEFGRVLLRQHTAALKRRSKQVQEELVEDLKLLGKLAVQEEEEKTIRTARRERAKTDASWMKQVIEDQMRLEKTREAELDMLYQDEAARVWQKREADWAQERLARQRLMQEVMDTRQDQITSKMAVVKQQQEESLQRREQLLEELELANQMTRRENEQDERIKTARKEELEAQISGRRDRDVRAIKFAVEELEKEKQAEGDYDDFLQREALKLDLHEYQPKSHGRKQAWS